MWVNTLTNLEDKERPVRPHEDVFYVVGGGTDAADLAAHSRGEGNLPF